MNHGPALVERYRRDGIVVVEGFAGSAELDSIAQDIAAVFVRRADVLGLAVPRGHTREDITAQLSALFAISPKEYIQAAKFAQHLISVHQFGVSPAMLTTLRALGIESPAISTRPVIHFMAEGLRVEGGYHKTPAHQDWRSVQGSLDGVTVWAPLFDVTESDYPVEVIVGSHKSGLLPSADHAFGHQVVAGAVDESTFTACAIKSGDAAFFSGFLVHRTGMRGGPLVRVALSYRFNNASEPTFASRGFPDRYIYKADMNLIDPEFPSPELVRTFFS